MGGEVSEFIQKHLNKMILCFGVCHKQQMMNCFKGYPHGDGLSDSSGKSWWVYFECNGFLIYRKL